VVFIKASGQSNQRIEKDNQAGGQVMRAIIIEDKDAQALMDKLKLGSMQEGNVLRFRDSNEPATLKEVHGAFVYVVVQWLQDQGCTLR